MTGLSRKLLVAFFSVACVTTSVSAQLPRQYPPARLLTRAEIEARLQEVEAAAQARDSSDQAREHARDEAELLARRLREGDFKAGDRILLYVQSEEALSDTFAVNAAGAVVLPSLGEVSLSGVLRSELSDRMSREISRYLRAPEVRAEPLLRVTVTGSVATPGFHTVSPDMLLTDVIMRVAGGPVGQAELDRLRIERDGDEIWAEEALRVALSDGRTLDQLSLQAGDVVVLPAGGGGTVSTFQTIATIISVPLSILTVVLLVR